MPLQFLRQPIMKINFLLLAALISTTPALADLTAKSPDNRITATLTTTNSQLTLSANLDKTPILNPSPLIFTLDGNVITTDIELHNPETELVKHSYPWRGH